MLYKNLDDSNINNYCIKYYNNPQCISISDYNDDIRRFKYIKRLINQFENNGTIKIRLLLNHIITIYNLFDRTAATRILFFKINELHWPIIKPILMYLNLLPEYVYGINNQDIKTSEIPLNEKIIGLLRENK